MRISQILSDDAVLKEIGQRLAARRVQREQTQAELAREAGVSPSTVTRIEAGKSAEFASIVRLVRALGLLANFDALIPEAEPTPMERLAFADKRRQRVRRSKSRPSTSRSWTWGDNGGDDK
jgi:transcriptional regulator with XRE-family HTH domain